MQWLAEISVRRPVFATVLSLVILVVGFASYTRLGVDRFPNIDIPFVTVTTVLPGASAEDIENDVTDRIEAAVNTIGGITEMRSQSQEGVSLVFIQFELERDLDVVAQEVRDKVAAVVPLLPDGSQSPVVTRIDPGAQPVLYIALQAPDLDPRELTDLAERVVVRRLENVSGVGEARLLGGRPREIRVELDPLALREHGVTAPEVARAIGTDNLTLPGGRVERGSIDAALRVLGRMDAVEPMRELVIRERQGALVRLSDVARVTDGVADPTSAAIYNGSPTLLIVVRKQSGVNTVAVAERVIERVEEIQANLPDGVTVQVVRNEAVLIETSTHAVTEHLILGSIFAAIVVLLFLGNVRSTIIAALAIPISIIGTFALMAMAGYTLNLITLLALALAVGIVIDDAIVVLENIWRHIDELGRPPMEAAVEATREIGLAVLATTISLVAVFAPIAFIAGIPGRFLASFGVTMSFAILVSLFVSFTITPMLSSRWLKKHTGANRSWLERLVDVFYRPLEWGYMHLLRGAMHARWLVVLIGIGVLMSVPRIASQIPGGFLPVNDTARLEISIRAPEGSSIAATELVAERIARQVRQMDHVTATLTTVADDEAKTPNVARIYVALTEPAARETTQNAIMQAVRDQVLPSVPADVRVQVNEVPEISGGGSSSASFMYIVSGPDLPAVEAWANQLATGLRQWGGAVDIDTSIVAARPEVGVTIDRERAAEAGVRSTDVATALNLLVGGDEVSSVTIDAERYDVRMRLLPEWRADRAAIGLFEVPTVTGMPASLSDFVSTDERPGPTLINRVNRQRQVTITANPAEGYAEGDIQAQFDRMLAEMPGPDGSVAFPTGRSKEMAAVGQSFVFGLLMAMIFVYLTLAAQFESWLLPISVLVSLPLTLPFALLSILLLDQQLDMFAGLGIFVLFGIVKKNGILQVDHTEQLRREGLGRYEAVMKANRHRLRPILMTTVAFVAGMLPLVQSDGVGAGYNKATAGVIVGGQVFSLLLTLVATPVAYTLIDDIANLARRLWAWVSRLLGGQKSLAEEPAE